MLTFLPFDIEPVSCKKQPTHMMYVSTLPIEVWAIIIKKLDTKSLCNLYESCNYLRNVICMHGVINDCKFSLNTLATVKSLKCNFLRDISSHLKILNLCGVSDLNKSCLIPALKRLKNLIGLDVSYTNIVLPDLHDIVKVCPTLKNVAINFIFGKKYKVTKNWLEDYQIAFGQLHNIHFVGSISDLLYGKLVIDMLKKADLLSLNFTVCGDYYFVQNYADDDPSDSETLRLSQFKLFFIKEVLNDPLLELPIFKSIHLKKYETVIFQEYSTNVTVHATPLLKEFIHKNYDVEVESLSELAPVVSGDAAVMLWHRDTTNFDSKFYSRLLLILKEYLVFKIDSSNLKPVPGKYKWCCVDQVSLEMNKNGDEAKEIMFKKARVAQPSFALNYEEAFRQKEDIKLRINFKEITRPVTIRRSEYLRKLSHLTLYGEVQYHPDFFKILFECCDLLVTLEIHRNKSTIAIPKLLQCLPNTKSLKNIYLSVSELLGQLFKYLCECRTLENIYLVNPTMVFEALPDPTDLFNKCDKLYSICVQSNSPDLDKMFKFYKKVRSKVGKDGLNIDMFPYKDERRTSPYSPYFSVFGIHQLKPLIFM